MAPPFIGMPTTGKVVLAAKAPCQVGRHTGSAQDNTVTIGAGRFGKGSGGFRRTVGGKNVRLKRYIEIFQHPAGTFYNRPVTVRTHDDGNLFYGSACYRSLLQK